MARASEDEGRDLIAHVGRAIDAETVRQHAESFALDRSAERAAVRARLDAAVGRAAGDLEGWTTRHRELIAARDAIVEGAAWAKAADSQVAERLQARESARAVLEVCQQDHRTALTALDRVLEQRSVAAAAMADADAKLGDLGVAEMDESKLRRELEASGAAQRNARTRHDDAVAALTNLRQRREAIEARRRELAGALLAGGAASPVDGVLVDEMRAALESWEIVASTTAAHPGASALARAWADLQADLASVQSQSGPLPAAGALAEAESLVATASAALAAIDAAGGAGTITPEERAELDAAHNAVLSAEERTSKRIGGGSARRGLDSARQREQELLERHGFAAYLDVVLTGGKVARQTPERQAAERSVREAVSQRDALRARTKAAPEVAYLQGEREKLLAAAAEVLGVEPGDRVVELLREHPDVPKGLVAALRNALGRAGVQPIGQSLADAARGWLVDQDAALARHRHLRDAADQVRADQLAADQDLVDTDQAIRAADAMEAESRIALEQASRSVSAFEGELTMRVDEDTRRLQRFAAAEQLRSQVEALTKTLGRAEDQARQVLSESTQAMAQADTDLDRAEAAVDDIIRRARSLAAELPAPERPVGEALTTLVALAAALEVHAERYGPEIDAANIAIDQAGLAHDHAVHAFRAADFPPGPREEDLFDGLAAALTAWDGPVLVDDPFHAFPVDRRSAALGVLLEASATREIVLLTANANLLGWAIELPSHMGCVLPAAALNLVPQVAEIDTNAATRTDAAATHRVARS